MAVIQRKISRKRCKDISQGWRYFSIVSCESIHHIGDRNRVICDSSVGRKNTNIICKKCSGVERRGKHRWPEKMKNVLSEQRKGNGNPMYGREKTQKQRDALKAWHKRRVFTEEYRANLKKNAVRGENHPNWNPNREEVKNKLKLQNLCRAQLRRLIDNRGKNWIPEEKLGYTYEEFRARIESTWEPWMNWSNNGLQYKDEEDPKWQLDHIKPIERFHKEGIFDPKIINALTNLRAIDANRNNKKNNKYMGSNKCYVDERGRIEIILESCDVKSISIIDSVANCTRANHTHPRDEHTILVTLGRIEYYEQLLDERPTKIVLDVGETYHTKAGWRHSMYFPEACQFHCYAKLPRDSANYESETIRFSYSLRDVYLNWDDQEKVKEIINGKN